MMHPTEFYIAKKNETGNVGGPSGSQHNSMGLHSPLETNSRPATHDFHIL
jgi:hypothetical protein